MNKMNLPPNNRDFGILFFVVFALLAVHAIYNGKLLFSLIFIAISMVTALITAITPNLLTPFKKIWMKLGELMGKVTSPIALGVIFFILLSPVGLITRFFGRDVLHLKKEKSSSYWKERNSSNLTKDSFFNQF